MKFNKWFYSLILLLLVHSHVLFAEQFSAKSENSSANFTDPIKVESGFVRGIIGGEKNNIRIFKGIPFAMPPVGELRWKAPKPAAAWNGVRDCEEFGCSCPQPEIEFLGRVVNKTDENCLYLNIWTPISAGSGGHLPVMVWIHGGGYTTGSGAQASYNGEKFAEKGVVLVTINYRLGPFGFFAHPLLSKESENGVSGNYGLLDQIAALKWVKKNIASFGGNPECVTIFGESAGASSVTCLMVCPLAKGLFHRVIAESGFAGGLTGLKSAPGARASMEQIGENIVRKLKLENETDLLKKLRSLTPGEILETSDAVTGLFGKGNKFRPCVDGYVLPDYPWILFEKGVQADIPFITGTNADEGSIFIKKFNIKKTAGYKFLINAIFRDNAGKIFSFYPVADRSDITPALSSLVSDMSFIMPARFAARSMGKLKSKSFLYNFTRLPEGAKKLGMGAFHSIELRYVFGNMSGSKLSFNDTDAKLSEIISAYWINFAATGDPNGKGLPEWPAYNREKDEHIEFGDVIKTGSGLHKDACDFFEKLASEKMGYGMESELSRHSGAGNDLKLPGEDASNQSCPK